MPAFGGERHGRSGGAALPKERISANFNAAGLGCKSAGVFQEIDQDFLCLPAVEIQLAITGIQVHRDGDPLFEGDWSNLMKRLIDSLLDLAGPKIRSFLDLAFHANLE